MARSQTGEVVQIRKKKHCGCGHLLLSVLQTVPPLRAPLDMRRQQPHALLGTAHIQEQHWRPHWPDWLLSDFVKGAGAGKATQSMLTELAGS